MGKRRTSVRRLRSSRLRLTLRGAPKHQYAVAPDGQRFLMVVSADETIASPITIVQNWLAGLQVP